MVSLPILVPLTGTAPSIGAGQLAHMVLLFIGGPLLAAVVLGTFVMLAARAGEARRAARRSEQDDLDEEL